MPKQSVCILFAILGISVVAAAQCSQDHRDDKKGGVVLTDVTISGTKTLSATDIGDMTSTMIGNCFNEDLDEMGERVRSLFQEHGYFTVEVKNLQLKQSDPLGVPRPATLEADVAEGPQFKVGEITFVKNRAFTAERLRQEFPMKPGEVFSRGKVAGGLESLWKLYKNDGYVDVAVIPDTRPGSNAIMDLVLTMEEGPQYRVEKVEFLGKQEVTGRLQVEWKMAPGSVYDASYVDKFIDENRALLPDGFAPKDVQVVRNCPKALVSVRVVVDRDGTPVPSDRECEK